MHHLHLVTRTPSVLIPALGRTKSKFFFLHRQLVRNQRDSPGWNKQKPALTPTSTFQTCWERRAASPARGQAEKGCVSFRPPAMSEGPSGSIARWVSLSLSGVPREWSCPWGLGPPHLTSDPSQPKGSHILAYLTKLKPTEGVSA